VKECDSKEGRDMTGSGKRRKQRKEGGETGMEKERREDDV